MTRSYDAVQTPAGRSGNKAWRVGAWATLIDILFIFLFILAGFLIYLGVYETTPVWMDIGHSRGLANIFNYLKLFYIIILMAVTYFRSKEVIFLTTLLIFIILLVDDVLEYHEKIGILISNQWGFQYYFGKIGDNIGELIGFAVLGIICTACGVVGYILSNNEGKRIALNFGILIIILAIIGVGLDFIHSLISVQSKNLMMDAVDHFMAAAEEGGEMVILSLILAYSTALALNALTPWEHFTAARRTRMERRLSR